MGILKVHGDKHSLDGNEKFIGLYADKTIDQAITLVSIYERTNKSSLLRRILREWMDRTQPLPEILTPSIASHYYHVWESEYRNPTTEKYYKAVLSVFRQDMRIDLLHRGLPVGIIVIIEEEFDKLIQKYATD